MPQKEVFWDLCHWLWPCQSFFWYDTNFIIYYLKVADYKFFVSVMPKEGLALPANPSFEFSMTTTKTNKDAFLQHTTHVRKQCLTWTCSVSYLWSTPSLRSSTCDLSCEMWFIWSCTCFCNAILSCVNSWNTSRCLDIIGCTIRLALHN